MVVGEQVVADLGDDAGEKTVFDGVHPRGERVEVVARDHGDLLDGQHRARVDGDVEADDVYCEDCHKRYNEANTKPQGQLIYDSATALQLIEGGEAKLELVKPDDPLQTGLEIFARPPGKKLSNISLLSGGEKTLTAISLIFSIFLINPSPICILDEVDAALDDINVEKFCKILAELKNNTKTKFLIITHHKITMSSIDRVYGVTMAQKGISDIVSVDFNKDNLKEAV